MVEKTTSETKDTQKEGQVALNPALPNSNDAEPNSVITQAEAVAKRIEDANKKTEELLLRQEQLYARSMLSGRAEAGSKQEEKKEETPKEYKDRIMRGG